MEIVMTKLRFNVIILWLGDFNDSNMCSTYKRFTHRKSSPCYLYIYVHTKKVKSLFSTPEQKPPDSQLSYNCNIFPQNNFLRYVRE